MKRQVEDESHGEFCIEQNVRVDADTAETNVGAVEKKINDAEDSIGDTKESMSEKHQGTVE